MKLPPLNSLRLFEVAARHESFKRAAEELHVTPSAVSHAVQALEEWLGTELFHRGPRVLTLTAAGSQLAVSANQGFSLLASATERVRARQATGTLSVSSAPTFATRWLLPRLPRFAGQNPNIQVSIDTSRAPVELAREGIDLAIRMARAPKSAGIKSAGTRSAGTRSAGIKSAGTRSAGIRSAGTWTRLVEEMLVPVCAPTIWARMEGRAPAVFSAQPLIHVTSVSQEWADWFESAGIEPPDLERGLRVDTIEMSMEAAAHGLGIALGRKPLVDEELAHGRLVEAGPVVRANTSYWLVGSPHAFERPETKLFRGWLLSEFGTAVR